jgi:NAD-dependent DNA ligase
VNDILLDILMAYRFGYYCRAISLLPDEAYDRLEAEFTVLNGPLPPGSDNEASYTPAQRALFLYLALKRHEDQQINSLI